MLKAVSDTLQNQANLSSIFYYWSAVFLVVLAGMGFVFRHYLEKTIQKETANLSATVASNQDAIVGTLTEMDKRQARVEYALYNDGKTGLINKVDSLIENQSEIKADIKVLFDRDERV